MRYFLEKKIKLSILNMFVNIGKHQSVFILKAILFSHFFFYTQLAFALYRKRGFYIVHAHIVAFLLFILHEKFDIFHETFLVVSLYYFGNIQLINLQTFLCILKKIYKIIDKEKIDLLEDLKFIKAWYFCGSHKSFNDYISQIT